jgi:glycosyltransferase involved in cell wall biosynthesis
VELNGWISRDRLADYLNKMKLLVLPSYTEGLPNIILEAMACGVPVLATSVGAIPDFIVDEKTGFLMKDNSPECIAHNVLRALTYPDLEQIAGNAKSLVEREFTCEKAEETYKKIIVSRFNEKKTVCVS